MYPSCLYDRNNYTLSCESKGDDVDSPVFQANDLTCVKFRSFFALMIIHGLIINDRKFKWSKIMLDWERKLGSDVVLGR